jgi:prepilin-type N-terminal cleavage/methylation domain-containing protein
MKREILSANKPLKTNQRISPITVEESIRSPKFKQKGFSLFELLISIGLLGTISIGLARSFATASAIIKGSDVSAIQSQLALTKLEEIAGRNPSTISTGEEIEGEIHRGGMSFKRVTLITALSDTALKVSVSVAANYPGFKEKPIVYDGVFNQSGLR